MALSKKSAFRFISEEGRSKAERALDQEFPQLRTSVCEQTMRDGHFYVLFVEQTQSFIFDSQVETLIYTFGGERRTAEMKI